MAKTKKASTPETPMAKNEAPRKRAVLFELENIAAGGRQVAFDVMKKIMADKGVKLTPFLFSRYVLSGSLKKGLGEMLESLGKGRLSEEKLASEVADEVKSALLRTSLTLDPGVKKLMARASAEGAAVGALSCLDRDTALQLVSKLKLDGDISTVLPYVCDGKAFPSADAWIKLGKMMSMSPGVCVVVATSSRSSKAALSSGMRCLVIPDKYTSFQDFGGADYVTDTLDEPAIDKIFSLLDER